MRPPSTCRAGRRRARAGFEAALHARLGLRRLCERAATHHAAGARAPRDERGGEITRISLDHKAGVFERLGEPSRRARLGEPELGIRVDLSTELDETRRVLDDRKLRRAFRIRDREREIAQAAAPSSRFAGSRNAW
jgi:hypothetical protein